MTFDVIRRIVELMPKIEKKLLEMRFTLTEAVQILPEIELKRAFAWIERKFLKPVAEIGSGRKKTKYFDFTGICVMFLLHSLSKHFLFQHNMTAFWIIENESHSLKEFADNICKENPPVIMLKLDENFIVSRAEIKGKLPYLMKMEIQNHLATRNVENDIAMLAISLGKVQEIVLEKIVNSKVYELKSKNE